MTSETAAEPQPFVLYCAECIGQRALAERRGVPAHELPQPNPALMVVNGTSVCGGHVQFNSPLIVGQS